jgi:uncharacterized protein GlcG (DUF336 family)
VRNQIRLTLAGARTLIAGAEVKAQSRPLTVNIAVVDDGGHLLAFERMDGARPASGYIQPSPRQSRPPRSASLRDRFRRARPNPTRS